ncbi:hypothetical protein BC835DRAFT_1100727 [Cytidiella melzeri]|nr:hypothetical protein BC835DRAFT_1100727 [Cytidiella melzeri]
MFNSVMLVNFLFRGWCSCVKDVHSMRYTISAHSVVDNPSIAWYHCSTCYSNDCIARLDRAGHCILWKSSAYASPSSPTLWLPVSMFPGLGKSSVLRYFLPSDEHFPSLPPQSKNHRTLAKCMRTLHSASTRIDRILVLLAESGIAYCVSS